MGRPQQLFFIIGQYAHYLKKRPWRHSVKQGCNSTETVQYLSSIPPFLGHSFGSGGNLMLLLLITAMASLLLGMGLPTTANYIIMASLTAPILVQFASQVHIHGMVLTVPLIAAHLYCFYFGILADDTPPVGLAAYAAAAIAEADPIKTGIQGFMYDIRTAILPFIFFFNHDIILWGITSLHEAIFIFIMTCLGSMTFASLTQGWFIRSNTKLESLLLILITLLLMYPALITGFILPHDYRYIGYFIGLALLVALYYHQRKRPEIPSHSHLAYLS